MHAVAAFIIGMMAGGIICFMIAACIFMENRQSEQQIYLNGYNKGRQDEYKELHGGEDYDSIH